MSEHVIYDRHHFSRTAVITNSAAEFVPRGSGKKKRPRADAATIKPVANSFSSLKKIDAGVLSMGYAETGPTNGPAVVLLHGWPYDIHSFFDVAPLLAAVGYRVIVPHLRGHGTTRFLATETVRMAQPSVLAVDIVALMDALRIKQAILAGFDWGAQTANIIAALWPERVKAMVSVNGYPIDNRERSQLSSSPPADRWWFQFYTATEPGRTGYGTNRNDFAKLMWKMNSPKWDFDKATFDRTAASFNNPDHASIVLHNYRWRMGAAEGDPRYDDLEKRLAEDPVIAVPTITLDGDSDGVTPASDGASYEKKFSGRHRHQILRGIGHNLPQEAPREFANAIVEVDGY